MKVNTRILVKNYDDIGCDLKEGYAPTIVQPKRYLGKKKSFDKKSTFSVTKFIENGEDAQSFLRWWRDDIEFGTLPFYVELPVMGGLMKTQVVMENDLSPLLLDDIQGAEKIPMSLKMISDIPNNTISITGINQTGGSNSCVYDDPSGCTVDTIYTVAVGGEPIGALSYKWTARGAEIIAGAGTDTITIRTSGTDASSSYGVTVDVSDDVYTLYANVTGVHTRVEDLPAPITIQSINHASGIVECDYNSASGCGVNSSYNATIVGDVIGSLIYEWEWTGWEVVSGENTNTLHVGDVGIDTKPFTISLTVSDDVNSDTLQIQGNITRTNVNEKPVITLVGGDLVLTIDDTYTELGATAADVGDGDITSEIVTSGIVDTSVAGQYIRYYNVTDSLGLAADEVERTVTIEEDVTSVIPNAPTNFTASDDQYEQITFSWDNSTQGNPTPTYDIRIHNGELIAENVTSVHIENIVAGSADYVVRAVNSVGGTDSDVDSGTSLTATIPKYELNEPLINDGTYDNINNSNSPLSTYDARLTESDGTAPYLPTELQYPQNGLLELANGRIMNTQFPVDTYSDTYGLYGIYDADGSTEYKIWALDLNGDTTATLYEGDQDTPITETGIIDIYFLSDWHITDGRPSWMPSLDVTKPVITMLGTSPVDVENGDVYTDAGATALDDVDGDITADIVTVNNVDTGTDGAYNVTYDVEDAAGNSADTVTRVVNVATSVSDAPIWINFNLLRGTGTAAHAEGDAFYQNQEELVSPEYDAAVQTGRVLALGATNDLPFDVPDGHFITIFDITEGRHIQFDSSGTEVVL